MATKKEMEELMVKFLTDTLSDIELSVLEEWLKTPKNKVVFQEYIKLNIAINHPLDIPNSEIIYKPLIKKIKNYKKGVVIKMFIRSLKYAAIIVMFIGIGNMLFNNNEPEVIEILKMANENITLKLENGNIEVISASDEKKIVDEKGNLIGVQKGSELSYKNKITRDNNSDTSKEKEEKLVYNELKIPYGKKFQLVLADGTKVFLNAGSTLTYPVKFIKGKDRRVFLEGEAYFIVAKDVSHPFIVSADEINVRVLGTEFNVSSYAEDTSLNTVLVEGAVSLYKKGEKYSEDDAVILKPGHLASWDKNQKEIITTKVNTYTYTAWMENKLIFKNTPFKVIRKKLERHYDVTIKNNNLELDKKVYQATFDVETIEQVMTSFKENYNIQYSIINNEIIIN